jgi:hypothetical protein
MTTLNKLALIEATEDTVRMPPMADETLRRPQKYLRDPKNIRVHVLPCVASPWSPLESVSHFPGFHRRSCTRTRASSLVATCGAPRHVSERHPLRGTYTCTHTNTSPHTHSPTREPALSAASPPFQSTHPTQLYSDRPTLTPLQGQVSTLFYWVSFSSSQDQVFNFNASDSYQQDWIGLRTLDAQGKVDLGSFVGTECRQP